MATEDECEKRFRDLFLKLKAQEEEAPKEEIKYKRIPDQWITYGAILLLIIVIIWFASYVIF